MVAQVYAALPLNKQYADIDPIIQWNLKLDRQATKLHNRASFVPQPF